MIEIDCEQGTECWADARRGIATASCADKIITPKTGELSSQAKGYACQLIAESFLPPHYWRGSDYQSSAMANGTLTEREARDYFEMVKNCDVRRVGFVLTDDKRFGCSPDGLIDPDEGLELKCPEHKKQILYLYEGVLPAEYRPQTHMSMVVTKRSAWNFMSYATGLPPLLLRVEADDYTLRVAEALEAFWTLYTTMRDRVLSDGDPVAATRESFVSPY